jgi:hypothetical protein
MRLVPAACLLILLPGCAGPSDEPQQTIEGYGPWKLDMTIAEARAAEPRAEPWESDTCEPGTCLSFFEPRFSGGSRQISADFRDNDRLHQILTTLVIEDEARCRKTGEDLRGGYVELLGAPDSSRPSGGFTFWERGKTHYALSVGCDSGLIAIVVSRPLRAKGGS